MGDNYDVPRSGVKDPFGAAIIWAEALGPTRFDGWDANGQPVGAPYATPYIPCLGTSEENTANTYTPLLAMAQLGPLNNLSGLDAGMTRVILPSGGKIEPVTASARARLGARMTFLTITESHLFTLNGGYRKLAGAVKRNCAGMNGRWLELTNGYDPSEGSEAQVTQEEVDKGDRSIYIDNVPSKKVDDLQDSDAVLAELIRQYGDSADVNGGWVNMRRILRDCQKNSHTEADRRRFFLNEIVVGESKLVNPLLFGAMAIGTPPLEAGQMITLGFDGSKYRDATALVACRVSDGALFEVHIWERPENADEEWRVPSAEVDKVVRATFATYDVRLMLADPFRWQEYLDTWSGEWPDKVVEYPTNVEQRFHYALSTFMTALADKGGIPHGGSELLTQHIVNAIIVKGSRMKARPGEDDELTKHYLQLAKPSSSSKIDGAIAAVLARRARSIAIEKGLTETSVTTVVVPSVAWR